MTVNISNLQYVKCDYCGCVVKLQEASKLNCTDKNSSYICNICEEEKEIQKDYDYRYWNDLELW